MAEPKCESCGTRMLGGFLLDHTHSTTVDTRWVEGKPDKNWMGSIKGLKGRRSHTVTAYLCERCGRMQMYAALR